MTGHLGRSVPKGYQDTINKSKERESTVVETAEFVAPK